MLADILGKLIPGAQSRELRSGQFLFRQGDRADYIFSLEHGQIILTRYLSDGKSVPMHAARAGQTFTEAALFSDIYHCNAVAGARSRVRMYAKHELLAAFERDPSLALQYVASLSREVQRLRTHLELHSIRSARERILRFLQLQAGPDSEYAIQGSLKDLATSLGLAHETFYRELARLESGKLITRRRGSIRLEKASAV